MAARKSRAEPAALAAISLGNIRLNDSTIQHTTLPFLMRLKRQVGSCGWKSQHIDDHPKWPHEHWRVPCSHGIGQSILQASLHHWQTASDQERFVHFLAEGIVMPDQDKKGAAEESVLAPVHSYE